MMQDHALLILSAAILAAALILWCWISLRRACCTFLWQRLRAFYTPDEAMRWLNSPHPQLGGRVPDEVCAAGGWEEVHAVVDAMDTGTYL